MSDPKFVCAGNERCQHGWDAATMPCETCTLEACLRRAQEAVIHYLVVLGRDLYNEEEERLVAECGLEQRDIWSQLRRSNDK